jgi:hypothetical protein
LKENWIEEFKMEEALDYCFSFVRDTAKTWNESDYPGKLSFQKIIFQEIIPFDGDRFGNPKLSIVYRLNRESAGQKSSLVARIVGCLGLWTP